jgi:hypothetical protein
MGRLSVPFVFATPPERGFALSVSTTGAIGAVPVYEKGP